MKDILVDVEAVKIERTTHDQGFLDLLRWNEKLRRLAGFELFDVFNRKMTVTIGD